MAGHGGGTAFNPKESTSRVSSSPKSAIVSSSSTSSKAKVCDPKTAIQHSHHHDLRDPYYGVFPTDNDNTEMGGGFSSAASVDSSSSASSTSGSEFDEMPASGINYCGTRSGGGHDNLPISTFLSVKKFKGHSLKKFKGSEIICKGGIIIRGERQRVHSDSSTMISPSVILTGDDDEENDVEESAVDGNTGRLGARGSGRNEVANQKTSSEADSSTDMDSQQLEQEQRRSVCLKFSIFSFSFYSIQVLVYLPTHT
ncbi:unnamed protein product [Orchesella dallaii]|uniref:Uncharacterized protein n=1 Tax=Orchesella dallaii TaxID=48710 RepID=A0ABP1QVU2_9HEXA